MAGHWIVDISNYSLNMDTLVTMWSVMACLIVFAFAATRKLSIVPTKVQAFCESIMGAIWEQADQIIGPEGRKHVPFVASLFLFILLANLMGQVPTRVFEMKYGVEFASPTNDLNVTAVLAVIVLIYYLCVGLSKKKINFFWHGLSFTGIILFLIDIMDMVTRPFSLALRLFCNILVGEILVGALISICAYVVPLPMMLFEVFVAFVQALVFMMLSIAYIAMAVAEEEA